MTSCSNSVEVSTPARPGASKHVPIGLELFTVRSQLDKDVPSTLKQIREIGYEEVEVIPSLERYPAKELRKVFADSGLRPVSIGLEYEKFASSFDYAKELGLDWMMLGTLPDSEGSSLEGFRRSAVQLNAWGKRAQEMGMRVAFHTHGYEFHPFNGVTGFDVLRNETDPELVFFELDCFWTAYAGIDPVQLIGQLGKRVRMLHLKDLKPASTNTGESSQPSAEAGGSAIEWREILALAQKLQIQDYAIARDMNAQPFTEIGSGVIPWDEVLALGQKLEIEHYIVEQDLTDIPTMESIRISYDYLRKILP